MTFRFANVEGRSALVDSDGRWFDGSRVSGGVISADPMSAWFQLNELHRVAGAISEAVPDGSIIDADVRPPIPSPRSVFAVGLNYRSHADESNMKVPDAPLIFTKFPSCLAGPEDPIVLGGSTDDYEAELVVVIGRGGRDIRPEDAWGHIGGLTVGQDISDRALQFAAEPPHFDLGKSRDTYGPIGPVVVSTDSFANPGDLIFTGTPDGVGAASLRFLADDDVITTTIEGIGTLTNRCRVPKKAHRMTIDNPPARSS